HLFWLRTNVAAQSITLTHLDEKRKNSAHGLFVAGFARSSPVVARHTAAAAEIERFRGRGFDDCRRRARHGFATLAEPGRRGANFFVARDRILRDAFESAEKLDVVDDVL